VALLLTSKPEIADVTADAVRFGRATERHRTDVGQVRTVAEPVTDVVLGLDVGPAAVLASYFTARSSASSSSLGGIAAVPA